MSAEPAEEQQPRTRDEDKWLFVLWCAQVAGPLPEDEQISPGEPATQHSAQAQPTSLQPQT